MESRVIDYQDSKGRDPIIDWMREVNKSNPKAVSKIIWTIDLLRANGLELSREYLFRIQRVKGLWELRATMQKNYMRVLFYNPEGTTLVLLHGFSKKTNETPQAELDTAARRMADDKRRRGL